MRFSGFYFVVVLSHGSNKPTIKIIGWSLLCQWANVQSQQGIKYSPPPPPTVCQDIQWYQVCQCLNDLHVPCVCFPGFAVAHTAQYNPSSASSTSIPSSGPTGPVDSVTASSASTHTVTQSQTGNKHTHIYNSLLYSCLTTLFYYQLKHQKLSYVLLQKHPLCKEAGCLILLFFSQ